MYVRVVHELSYRLATIAELGRDAALERFAEEDTEYAAQHGRLSWRAGLPAPSSRPRWSRWQRTRRTADPS
jgi:hypothetical protein